MSPEGQLPPDESLDPETRRLLTIAFSIAFGLFLVVGVRINPGLGFLTAAVWLVAVGFWMRRRASQDPESEDGAVP